MTEHSDLASPQEGDGQPPADAEAQARDWVPHSKAGQESAVSGVAAVAERPEVQVGAAFAGGLLAALILRRLAR